MPGQAPLARGCGVMYVVPWHQCSLPGRTATPWAKRRTSSLRAALSTAKQRVLCSPRLFIFISTSTIFKGNFREKEGDNYVA